MTPPPLIVRAPPSSLVVLLPRAHRDDARLRAPCEPSRRGEWSGEDERPGGARHSLSGEELSRRLRCDPVTARCSSLHRRGCVRWGRSSRCPAPPRVRSGGGEASLCERCPSGSPGGFGRTRSGRHPVSLRP